MVLKFLIAGVISAILAGAAIFLLLDDETVDRIRAERERLQMSEIMPDLSRYEADKQSPDLLDRLLGRDAQDAPQSKAVKTQQKPSDDPRLEHGVSEESRVGKRIQDEEIEPPPSRGWLGGNRSKGTDKSAASDMTPPATYDILLEQAALLQIDDARDDAYFSILSLALSDDRMDIANQLVERLSVPPLRDTARQRIGMAHAQAGRVDAAFAVLDGIEIDELSDPIRLEIIRVITDPTPQPLPQ